MLYVFLVLSLERRRVLHVNVTAHPNATWAGQQIVEALGPEEPPMRHLIRDRDGIYGRRSTHASSTSRSSSCPSHRGHRGKTDTRSDSWVRCAASCSTTWSFLVRDTCFVWFVCTPNTTTEIVPTRVWPLMLRCLAWRTIADRTR